MAPLTLVVCHRGTAHLLGVSFDGCLKFEATTGNGVRIAYVLAGDPTKEDEPRTVYVAMFANASGVAGLGCACLVRLLRHLASAHPTLEWVSLHAGSQRPPGAGTDVAGYSEAAFACRFPAAHAARAAEGADEAGMRAAYAAFASTERLMAYYERTLGLRIHNTGDACWAKTSEHSEVLMAAPLVAVLARRF